MDMGSISDERPTVVNQQCRGPIPMVPFLHVGNALMKTFALLITDLPAVTREEIQVEVQKVDLGSFIFKKEFTSLTLKAKLNYTLSYFEATRGLFSDKPRKCESWSDDEDDTGPAPPAQAATCGRVSTWIKRASGSNTRRIIVESDFEPGTPWTQSLDLATAAQHMQKGKREDTD
ncbi:hypothetical protein AVEN_8608-1 [Araneus ventricosus]|uniref:Uncharacterized protein n=1 Tax=Araneus ventricosus TaxID=182803 RepID=A0A4Y2C2R5_ARAVE|nr:hypothetical protein AVEN_8608-1 [Araneus ventricosus]